MLTVSQELNGVLIRQLNPLMITIPIISHICQNLTIQQELTKETVKLYEKDQPWTKKQSL